MIATRSAAFVLSIAVAFVLFETMTISSAQVPYQSKEISVRQFGQSNVIGYLGHPLGTVVKINGKRVTSDYTRRRADLGKVLLEIQFVNETKLEPPFIVPVQNLANGLPDLQPGEKFDYYAHEWGCFSGHVTIPAGIGIPDPIVANDGFHYRPQITIHKSNPLKVEVDTSERPSKNQD